MDKVTDFLRWIREYSCVDEKEQNYVDIAIESVQEIEVLRKEKQTLYAQLNKISEIIEGARK